MSAIIVLIGISLVVALIFLGVFIWSVKSNQYEDTYTPSIRILFEDDDRQRTATQTGDDEQS
ncbi:cbb3-type cytochrome oxidase assembly protein CcoS [Flammeovirga yaeyamensis]|uniref:Cbb3-type cytochrome oxidase assembly protein CcoS n=1 Tax=Flammeovirga yaeyamensis TaxID=367791 RepID=A0AAX1N1W0_9BACT|nr:MULTISPECIES: cbb3-type cytochrome oxidase assembly protein CcoS [Flammeovirga]ANQ51124.2 cbb3-type cytochrome oxidase assembly protein CcoS [Flammeovirga sp. MY04]MBB3698151.1 cbb3-type cytochrome oxidase maturation protein [Flammeovirga yaeyamensis]NMF34492.1 cbb3-type cytochrome oxidase assembly protein CcoS [Flammeovirga yaeyamensis]QWG01470.1 cbb3-type cytochrome oxidase assembly protein CcoS [Flammeovirga yaeyamensis]